MNVKHRACGHEVTWRRVTYNTADPDNRVGIGDMAIWCDHCGYFVFDLTPRGPFIATFSSDRAAPDSTRRHSPKEKRNKRTHA